MAFINNNYLLNSCWSESGFYSLLLHQQRNAYTVGNCSLQNYNFKLMINYARSIVNFIVLVYHQKERKNYKNYVAWKNCAIIKNINKLCNLLRIDTWIVRIFVDFHKLSINNIFRLSVSLSLSCFVCFLPTLFG